MNRTTCMAALSLLLPGVCVTAASSVAAEQGDVILLAQAQQPAQGQPPPPTPQQRVAMLKQWLQASQVQLRSYEWVETTVVAVDGEEKARHQNSCYYGMDGKIQKTPLGAEPEKSSGGPPIGPGRLMKKAAAQKKEDMEEYMKKAAALVQSYVPPDSNRIQQSVDSGKFTVNMLDPGKTGQLVFHDYLKSGDQLAIDIELPTNRLLGMHVSSYLDTPKDAVQLDVGMGVLPDGTIYTSQTKLSAPAEDIVVTIENSGYRHSGQ